MSLLGGLLSGVNAALSAGKTAWDVYAQKKTWDREDSAVQRRVKDLEAAGLSPTLAAGSAASTSAPINVSVPQADIGPMVQSQAMANARAQQALTDTQQRLANQQLAKSTYETQSAKADALMAQSRMSYLSSPDSNGYPGTVLARLIDSDTQAKIATNLQSARNAQDAIYNSDLAHNYGLPVGGAALDAITQAKQLETIGNNGITSGIGASSLIDLITRVLHGTAPILH